jgi:hypothetical protein
MRGIGIEKAAPIGAKHLDRDLRRDWAKRDRLLGPFQRVGLDVRAKCLRHALPHKEKRIEHANREEYVEGAASEIDPEVSDSLNRVPCEAADERDREHDAGGS